MTTSPNKCSRKLVVVGNGMAAGRKLEEFFARAPGGHGVTIFGAELRVGYDRIMRSPVSAGDKAFTCASALDDGRDIPAWVDRVLERAVAIDPLRRYEALSEFVHELRHGGAAAANAPMRPLIGRNPLRFWQVVALPLLAADLLQMILVLRDRWPRRSGAGGAGPSSGNRIDPMTDGKWVRPVRRRGGGLDAAPPV